MAEREGSASSEEAAAPMKLAAMAAAHRRRSTGSTGIARSRGTKTTETSGGPVVTPPLFNQVNVRKPEYWQFARLIAPAEELPEGKKAWTAHDAIGIWCMRCCRVLSYQMGSSQSIRYHMETKHSGDLSAFRRQHTATSTEDDEAEGTLTPVVNGRGTKRKERATEAATAATTVPSDISAALANDASAPLAARPAAVRSATSTSQRRQSTDVGSAVSPPSPKLAPAPARVPASVSHGRSAASTGNIASATSWHRNVQRRGGFWGNAYWYDLNLLRRMPLADRMLEELLAALPPCDGKRVLDLCAGSGRAAAALLAAYPTAMVTLVDSSSERLAIAQKRLLGAGAVGNVQFVVKVVDLAADNDSADDTATIMNAMPVDVVVASLALHVLAEAPAHYAQSDARARADEPVEVTYERIFRLIFRSLAPGGHVVFADHVGQLGLFAQLQAMARAGFVDVDCAWRQDDSFVAGGRRPLL